MTKEQVKEILDRVLAWPPERQADIAHTVELMEAQDKSDLQLSDEQLAEVAQAAGQAEAELRFNGRCTPSLRSMRIVFDDEAIDDLRGIRAWIAEDNPRAADEFIERISPRLKSARAGTDLYGASGSGSRHARVNRISLHHRLRSPRTARRDRHNLNRSWRPES